MFRALTASLALLLAAQAAVAFETVTSVAGKWKSHRGAIYESDGSNLTCVFIPESLEPTYGYWLGKTRLEGITRSPAGLTATQILRWPDGKTIGVPARLEVTRATLSITFTDPRSGEPVVRTFTRVAESESGRGD